MRFIYIVMMKMVQNEEFISFAYNELRATALENETDSDSLKIIYDMYIDNNSDLRSTYIAYANELGYSM